MPCRFNSVNWGHICLGSVFGICFSWTLNAWHICATQLQRIPWVGYGSKAVWKSMLWTASSKCWVLILDENNNLGGREEICLFFWFGLVFWGFYWLVCFVVFYFPWDWEAERFGYSYNNIVLSIFQYFVRIILGAENSKIL